MKTPPKSPRHTTSPRTRETTHTATQSNGFPHQGRPGNDGSPTGASGRSQGRTWGAVSQRYVREDHDARFGHLLHRESQTLTAEARVLRTPVRHLVRTERRHVVDDDAADLDRAVRLERAIDVVREHPGLQPEPRVVHELERVLEGLVRAYRHDRAEDLLTADLHLRRHVGQERRLEERTLAGPTREDLRALGHGLLDPATDPVDLGTLDHRSDVDGRIERIAHLQLLHRLRQELGEPVVDVARDVDPLDADAALSRLVVAAERDALSREVQVGIGMHDHAGVPTELERHALLRIEALQVPADLRGAGEADLAEPLVPGHTVGDLRADG